MTRLPRILIFADCGPFIGGGHVMRCLTLARAATARGAACAFVAPPSVTALLRIFAPAGIEALAAPEAEPDLAAEQARLAAERYAPDWLVIDHYRLERRHESALRAPGRRLMILDDLAQRARDGDLVLDPGYGRMAQDYRGLLPAGAQVLAGPRYALVRPEFAALREQALARRGSGEVRRILLALGLTDVGGATGQAARALLPVLGDRRLDVVVGGAAPSLADLRVLAETDPRLSLHIDAVDMARLTAEADLAVGAGGSSVWERACLGLPAVTLVLADNQRALAQRMAAQGLTLAVEALVAETLRGAFERLTTETALRTAMSRGLADLCDGLGAERAAEALIR